MTRFLARSFRSRPARWSVGPVGSRLEELEQRVVPTQAPTQIVTYVSPSPIAISSIDVNDAQSVTGATVRITSGLVPTEDQLLFTNQNGIVGTYTAATGTLTLRGTASGVAYGEALDSIQYSDTAAVPTPGDRTIQFQLGAATYFSGTGHYYQFVSFPVSPTWLTAESDANSRADLGLTGYLATITSQAEQTFVASLVGGSTAWLGGSDAFSGGENVWDWVTGPEGTQNGGAGLPFYNSLGPVGGAYTNWSSGNPNNSASGYVAMSANGTWVSLLNGGTVGGEVVEFGGLGTAPSFYDRGIITVHVLDRTAAPTVASPAAAPVVNTASYSVTGTAPANSLVQVFLDADDNGVPDTPGSPLASQQLSGGAASFSISTPLTPNAANHFVVLATAYTGANPSDPQVVPTITEDSVPPTVTGTSPDLTGLLPAEVTSLQVDFSEPVLGGGTASNYDLRAAGPDGQFDTPDDLVVALAPSYAGTAATLSFPALASGSYRLTVTSGITDVAGNALDGNGTPGSDHTAGFTVDAIPPTVTGTSPALGGLLPAGVTSLQVDFSEPVLGGASAANYDLRAAGPDGQFDTPDDLVVALAPSYAGTTATLSFPALASGNYRLTVGAGITDPAGNALDGNYVRDFTVDATPPTVTGTSPALGGLLPAGVTSLQVDFSEPVLGGASAANYDLRAAGPDGQFDTPDDLVVALAPSYAGTAATLAFPALASGSYRLTVTSGITDVAGNALDGNGTPGSDYTAGFTVAPLTTAPLTTEPQLTVGGLPGGGAQVFDPATGGQYPATPTATPNPFAGLGVVVRSTVADINGDGHPDTIIVTGPGVPVQFAVVSGADNSTLLVPPTSPFAGSEGFTGGGFVSAGDLDGDGRAEIVLTPDQGGGPRVTIFSLSSGGTLTLDANFLGIDDPNFRGGARTAVGDVNDDGHPDLAVAAGFLGGPRVALYDGTTLLTTRTKLVSDFFAFPGSDAQSLRNGAFVAIGDVTGDGFGDLVFGGGPGGAPRVFVLSGALVAAGDVAGAQAAPVANFFVGNDSADRGGARVGVVDADGDGRSDIAVGSGPGDPARVRVYLAQNITPSGEPTPFQDVSPFGGNVLTDGVYVG